MSLSRRLFGQAAAGAAVLAVSPRFAQAQSAGVYQHGVASGDPLPTRVIIWTRLSQQPPDTILPVEWTVATDPQMNRVVRRGQGFTSSDFDFTVKIDVERLQPNTTYYYQFRAAGQTSPIGRTKTLPVFDVSRLRFAFVSCSNYPYGFFNVYRMIAQRADLDFVLHLGDYIYEYANSEYGNGTPINRVPAPNRETTTLADYRTRYAQYRADPDLQELHRQHAMIAVWDDHESTNDAWRDGAENHTPGSEGDWGSRRGQAEQAWFEWMPVRANAYEGGNIYRTFRFGNLMDIIMLDTRLVGRDQQAANFPASLNPDRTLLGYEQEEWLEAQLQNSRNRDTRWRALGQQVMMSQLVGPTGPLNPDQWDGYSAARGRLLGTLDRNFVNNTVVLTGDIHSSWANEISVNPFAAATARRQMVEFVTPAVSSPGIDDRAQANELQAQIGATHPHVRYVELFRRGYVLMDVTRDRIQGEFYHIATITERRAAEEFARAFQVAAGSSTLTPATAPATPPTGIAPLAP